MRSRVLIAERSSRFIYAAHMTGATFPSRIPMPELSDLLLIKNSSRPSATGSELRKINARWVEQSLQADDKHGKKAMTCYKVSFFKNRRGSDGHPVKRLQHVIDIRHARSFDRAVKAAEREYEHFHRVTYWWLQADFFEVEIDGRKIDYHPSPVQG